MRRGGDLGSRNRNSRSGATRPAYVRPSRSKKPRTSCREMFKLHLVSSALHRRHVTRSRVFIFFFSPNRRQRTTHTHTPAATQTPRYERPRKTGISIRRPPHPLVPLPGEKKTRKFLFFTLRLFVGCLFREGERRRT